jgi:hypothetical protein
MFHVEVARVVRSAQSEPWNQQAASVALSYIGGDGISHILLSPFTAARR